MSAVARAVGFLEPTRRAPGDAATEESCLADEAAPELAAKPACDLTAVRMLPRYSRIMPAMTTVAEPMSRS